MGGALVGVLVACGAGAVAAERLTSQPVTNKSVVHCHSTDSLTGGRNYSGSDVASAASPSGTNPEDALQACRLLWSAGLLVPGARHALSLPNPLSYDHPVPPLAVCRMPDGTAGVFPGASPVCSRLGLPTAGAA